MAKNIAVTLNEFLCENETNSGVGMKFEFAKYTEITDYAFKINPDYKTEGYVRFFICPDVWDFWFVRILEGYNGEYEQEEGSFLLERNKVEMSRKNENLTLSKVKEIIQEDDGSNWDFQQGYDIEELINMLDDGFGIINRKKPSLSESVNTDNTDNIISKLDELGVVYELSGNEFKPFKVIYKPINKSDEFYKMFDDLIHLNNLMSVVKQGS